MTAGNQNADLTSSAGFSPTSGWCKCGDLEPLTESKSTLMNPSPLETVSLREFIAFELSLVKEVEAVLTAKGENELHVWTVVDAFERSVREKIYKREQEIINEFPTLEFDFNILSRRGRMLCDIINDDSLDLTFQRKKVTEVSAD